MTTIHQDIQAYLTQNGRSTTGEMAQSLGHETREVRQACKELEDDGQIQGSKSKRIPAYIINGDYVVTTGNKGHLVEIVTKYGSMSRSAAQKRSVSDLQRHIRNQLADRQVGGPAIWEFWV